MSSRVSTLAFDPLMKNSVIDCAWAMPKAETTVPQRLAAPPKVTTRKASTMYSEPLVGPVEPMVVNAAPAIPATPQPTVIAQRRGKDPRRHLDLTERNSKQFPVSEFLGHQGRSL